MIDLLKRYHRLAQLVYMSFRTIVEDAPQSALGLCVGLSWSKAEFACGNNYLAPFNVNIIDSISDNYCYKQENLKMMNSSVEI